MKIAILGDSPLALECALRFHLHGAALTWYKHGEDFLQFSTSWKKGHLTSDLGENVLKEINAPLSRAISSWKDWQDLYQNPIVSYLKAHQEVKTDEVISVTKRFLAPNEIIPGSTRFHDLFRVIYRVNPKEFIEEQKESNPETYKRLSEEFLQSLASTIEMYQDYDLVLDLRTDLSKASAAVSGRALGESRKSDKVLYGLEALLAARTAKATTECREIALVGSGSLSAEILISLSDWLKDERSRLFVVSSEDDPYENFLKNAEPEIAEKVHALFDSIDTEFQKDIETFTKKLREWQELDDFVQVKIPKPVEPIPRLVFFSGHNVTAMDELIDRKRMFLTLEKPDFRSGKKQPENNELDLKTVGVDLILISHTKKDFSFVQLDQNEKGYFEITPVKPNLKHGWEENLKALEGIEDEIFKLFSPVDAH